MYKLNYNKRQKKSV